MDIAIRLRGETALGVPLEVAADQGGAGAVIDMVRVPPLGHLGLATPEEAAALALEYQVAQKLHACTDPHKDDRPNDRVHDVVDLMLVRDAYYADGSSAELRAACVAIFDARLAEAEASGHCHGRGPPPWSRIAIGLVPTTASPERSALRCRLSPPSPTSNTWIGEIEATPAAPEGGA